MDGRGGAGSLGFGRGRLVRGAKPNVPALLPFYVLIWKD